MKFGSCAPALERILSSLLIVTLSLPDGVTLAQSAVSPDPVVTRRVINEGGSQRSTVTNISLFFHTNVALSATSLVLRNLTFTNKAIASTNLVLNYDSLSNKATWTFPSFPGGSLPEGNYIATLFANTLTNSSGHRLDGNNDSLPGDAYTFDLFRFFGDFDGDRDVDFFDNHWFQKSRESNASAAL